MMINGLRASNGLPAASNAALHRRQQNTAPVTAIPSGFPSSTDQPRSAVSVRSQLSKPMQSQANSQSHHRNIEQANSRLEREYTSRQADAAISAYLEQDIKDKQAEISRLMGIDVYA